MITLKFYLRTSRTNRAGASALYFIVNTGSPVWIATKLFIDRDHWNQKKEMLLPSCPDYSFLSPLISNLKFKADLYLQQVNLGQLTFKEQDFKKAVIDAKGSVKSLTDSELKDLITEYYEIKNFSWGRIKHYRVLKNDLQKFRPGARLSVVNYVFALEFNKYLKTLNNVKATVAGKFGQLKAVLHYAQFKGVLKEDVLKGFKLNSIAKSHRTALTKDELMLLQNKFDEKVLPANQQNVLRYFLFCCYTGLRYGDIYTLEREHIINDMIIVKMHKTEETVSIPLLPQAQVLMEPQASGKCFRCFCNQKTNTYLKEIAEKVGIAKKLTFHVSRHTFATISLSLGIPIKVISKLLGHTKVSTTEIYTHVMDGMKQEEMKKWQNLIA